jgi:hypothetical protein
MSIFCIQPIQALPKKYAAQGILQKMTSPILKALLGIDKLCPYCQESKIDFGSNEKGKITYCKLHILRRHN